jgi:hypothetical protein
VALALLGLILTGVAVYLTGASTAQNYFQALDTFRVGDPGKLGGFWYKGADIAVFGTALVLPRSKTPATLISLLLAMMFIGFFLNAGKGGVVGPLLMAALVLWTYSPRRFWLLAKPRIALACLIVGLLGLGIKVQFLAAEKGGSRLNLESISGSIVGPLEARWGDQGLYRGFCQFINLLPKYHFLFEGYREGLFALTEAWVPRAIRTNKRDQPTEGLGFMIHADAHTYKEETPSIELVGSVFADNGFYSLTAYLLIVGFLLGVLRRYAAGRRSALQWHIPYFMFAVFGGLSAEAGIAGTLYTFILTFTVAGIAHVAVVGLCQRKLHARALPTLPHHSGTQRDWSRVRIDLSARP